AGWARPLTCKREGSATVWLAISLLAIIGIVALGLDGGRMMEERRRAQAAADAAALAAAKQGGDWLRANPGQTLSSTVIVQAATDLLASNGYVSDGVAVTLAVRLGPASGQFQGRTDCVEVVIDSKVKATFGRIFTGGDPVVRARAVARFEQSKTGLLLLQPSGANALS